MKNKLKSIAQKITIVISILLTFTFVVPTHVVQADVGGILLSPFVALLAGIGDGAMTLLQWAMIGDFSEVYQEKDDITPTDINLNTSAGEGNPDTATILNKDAFNGDYKYPVFKYSPEQIFNNKIAALDANFIQNSTAQEGKVGQDKSSVANLRPVIAKWYVAIRNLALVGLLSVLVYVGIRMLISSASSDKAKYKQMLFDWIVAVCLLFIFHFIMSFVMIIVDNLTDMLGSSTTSIRVHIGTEEFDTNLMGLARLGIESKNASEKISFTIIYLVLVIYTGIFTFIYLKRLLYMAFLTLMAPLVTLTYPIDKISDGKAQAFDTWLKEYIFNALLQPFHLLLYTILVSSAIELAANNMLYAIAAIGFLLPAEKLLRRMFGFEKAGTASALGAFAGGALASQAISKMASAIGGKGGKSGSSSGGSGSGGGSSNDNIRTAQRPGLLEGMNNNGEADNEQEGRQEGRQERQQREQQEGQQGEQQGRQQREQQEGQQGRQQNNENANEQFRSRIPQAPQGFRNRAKAVGKVAGKKALKTAKKTGKRMLKAAPGTLAKAAGAATFGLMGLAAGVATGDMSKVAQFAGAGAAAGGVIGGAVEGKLENGISSASQGIRNIYNEGLYGEEGARLMENKRNYAKDDAHKANMKQLIGSDSKETMDLASDFAISGIKGDENIANAIKYQRKLEQAGLNREQAFTQAAQAANIVQDYGEESFRDPKKREAAENDMADKIMVEHLERTGREMTETEAQNRAKAVMSAGDQYLGRKKARNIN